MAPLPRPLAAWSYLLASLVLACGGDGPGATGDTSTSTSASTTGSSGDDTADPTTPTTSGAATTAGTGTGTSTTTTDSTTTPTSGGTTEDVQPDTTTGTTGTTTDEPGTTVDTGTTSDTTDTTDTTTDTGVAPCMTWDRTHGGAKADYGNALVQVPGDGFALAGRTFSKGAGADDMWLVRVDEAGEVLWDQTYGTASSDSANAVALAPDGGFLLVGTSYTNQTSLDWSVVRTTSDGAVVWTRTFSTADADHAFAAVAVAGGGFAVAGTRDRVAKGTGRFWLIRLDDEGDTLWEQIYGDLDSEQLAYDLVEFPQGGFAVAGTANDAFWLVRTDAAGNKLWDRAYDHDPAAHDRALALVRMPDDGLVLAGWSQGGASTDGWIVRTDAAGDPLWDATIDQEDHDFVEGMAATADGGLVLVGHAYATGQPADLRMHRTDKEGKLVWTRQYGGAGFDLAADVTVLPNHDLAVVGRTASKGAGDLDVWALRTSPTGELVCE